MIFHNSIAQSGAMITGYISASGWRARLGSDSSVFGPSPGLRHLRGADGSEYRARYYEAHDDRKSVERCFGLGLIAVSIVALMAIAFALLAAPLVAEVLGDVLDADQMRIALLSAASIMVLSAYRSVMRDTTRAATDGASQRRPDCRQRHQIRLQSGGAGAIARSRRVGDGECGCVRLGSGRDRRNRRWSPVPSAKQIDGLISVRRALR